VPRDPRSGEAVADCVALHRVRRSRGLLTYGPSLRESFRRCGVYVAKILNGAKPAELPIERPEKFDLVINMETAKALRLTIPQLLQLRADRLIQ
jgi:putative tryptophan/tyrosine transport system substrate-binding protein